MILFAQEPCSPSQAAPRLGGRRSIYPTLHHTVCFFHSSVCSVLLSFTKFCAVNDLDLCFFGRSKLFQSLSLGQPCVAQCPCIKGARGLGEGHCCHFDQISTNQPNRHHITSCSVGDWDVGGDNSQCCHTTSDLALLGIRWFVPFSFDFSTFAIELSTMMWAFVLSVAGWIFAALLLLLVLWAVYVLYRR